MGFVDTLTVNIELKNSKPFDFNNMFGLLFGIGNKYDYTETYYCYFNGADYIEDFDLNFNMFAIKSGNFLNRKFFSEARLDPFNGFETREEDNLHVPFRQKEVRISEDNKTMYLTIERDFLQEGY